MADIIVRKKDATTIVIPERIDYEDARVRIPIPSGTIVAGDYSIAVRVVVRNKDSGIVMDETARVIFRDMDPDSTKEIIGMVTMAFNNSPKPV